MSPSATRSSTISRWFWSASSCGRHARLVGGDQDRGAVLVGAGDHEHVVAGHPHVAAEDVGGHAETGHVADVARAVGVRPGDGGQDFAHAANPRRRPPRSARRVSAADQNRSTRRCVRLPDPGQLVVEQPPGAGGLVGVAVPVDDRQPRPRARRVAVAALRDDPHRPARGRGRSGPASRRPAARSRRSPRVGGSASSKFPITETPVEVPLNPSVCAPRTRRAGPPARPTQVRPNRSTRKL